MRKVLMISCEGLGKGGIQDVMMKIVRNCSDQFHFDMVLFTKEIRFYDKEFVKYGTIFRLPPIFSSRIARHFEYYFQGLRIYYAIRKIIRENGPYDIIHCHNYFCAAYCLKAAKDEGVKIRIAHAHNTKPLGSREYITVHLLNDFLRRIICKYATNLIACSSQAANYMFNKNATIIPNCIDINDKKYNNLSYSQNCIKLLNVGRFSIQKNQVMCINILNKLIDKGINAHLTLMGLVNGIEGNIVFNELKLEIEKNNLEKHVTFKSGKDDVIKEMRENDIFLLPSLYEGFGIVLLEAQSVGMKCIASNAVPYEVNAGLTSFCDINNIDDWIKEIINFESNKTKRVLPDMSEFSTKKIMKEYKKIYNKYGIEN